MKKILITGKDSYIGTSFENYIKNNYADSFAIDTIDMIDESWRQFDFSNYESVFHVAGIAHKKETSQNAHLYYSVNCDLAIECAIKAKMEGVKQFVFLSSMSVYGIDEGRISTETIPKPKNNYGKSKLEAETQLIAIADDSFNVCIIRPPMVYGEGCKGNYQSLIKIAKLLPIIPDYKNQRSMISINTLVDVVKTYIDGDFNGIYAPQDSKYVCTSEMMENIRSDLGKCIHKTKAFNVVVLLLSKLTTKGKKAFGNLVYDNFDILKQYEN